MTACTTIPHNVSSTMVVPELPGFDLSADWAGMEDAFRSGSVFAFAQSWKEVPEPGFRGGTVRMGWSGDRFLVLAELKDDLVTTSAARRNEMLFQLGDVFEVFAGVKGDPAYIEYHVAPNDTILQLAFPTAESIRSGAGIETFLRVENESILKARKVPGGWQAFAAILKSSLAGSEGPLRGQEWELNFGRYDYGADGAAPVLSSTSPLTVAGFHRRAEWRTIRFE